VPGCYSNPTTLPACRLRFLPDDVLDIIARNAGRPARRACKMLHDAYGPLDCGLRLEDVTTAADITSLLTLHPQRLSHITALQLTAPPGHTAYSADFLEAVARSFPQLGNLRFPSGASMRGDHLSQLRPLAPSLTSLMLPPTVDSPSKAVASLLGLTSLHTLTLPGTFAVTSEVGRLSDLKQLQHLDLQHRAGLLLAPAHVLPALRTLSGLTSLAIRPTMVDFDHDSRDMLRTALPCLSALTLLVDVRFQHQGNNAPTASELVAALGHRTALTSLSLAISCTVLQPHGDGLGALSSLGLARLRLEGSWLVDELLRGAAAAAHGGALSALTRLHLAACCGIPRKLRRVAPNLKAFSLSNARVANSATCFQGNAQTWGQLTELRLVNVTVESPGEGHGGIGLGKMSNLEVLEISNQCTMHIHPDIQEMRQLTRLRELSLRCCDLPRCPHAVNDKDIRRSLLLLRQLTRLELGGLWKDPAASRVKAGQGLAVVRRLSRLKELRLCNLAVLTKPRLPRYLLPLPASLRRLELECGDELRSEVLAAVQAATDMQDCALRVGGWR
jgi:hypothetical protein